MNDAHVLTAKALRNAEDYLDRKTAFRRKVMKIECLLKTVHLLVENDVVMLEASAGFGAGVQPEVNYE